MRSRIFNLANLLLLSSRAERATSPKGTGSHKERLSIASVDVRSFGRRSDLRMTCLWVYGPILQNSPAESADTGNITTNGEGVDIVRAFVGRDGLEIHKVTDHGIAVGNADGAK